MAIVDQFDQEGDIIICLGIDSPKELDFVAE